MAKTLEERVKSVQDVLNGQMIIIMTRPLKAGTLKNRVVCKSRMGYSVEIDNLSYRGVWLSTLEGIRLWVDDVEIPQENMMICLKDLKMPLCDMEGHTEIFWGARDTFTINVYQVGGLAPGEHKVAVEIAKRSDFGHSYGEGTEGYEEAREFHHPQYIRDEAVYVIEGGD